MAFEIIHQLVAGLFLWTLLCLAASTAGLYARTSEFWRAFWFMTAMWALVDGAIAWFGLVRPPIPPRVLTPILLINAGLDVAYIASAGILLSRKAPKWRGFGLAILIQGVFLLAFDLTFWRSSEQASHARTDEPKRISRTARTSEATRASVIVLREAMRRSTGGFKTIEVSMNLHERQPRTIAIDCLSCLGFGQRSTSSSFANPMRLLDT